MPNTENEGHDPLVMTENEACVIEYATGLYGLDAYEDDTARVFALLVDAARACAKMYVNDGSPDLARATSNAMQGLIENLETDSFYLSDVRVWRKHAESA